MGVKWQQAKGFLSSSISHLIVLEGQFEWHYSPECKKMQNIS
jgi:hypothetical protein